MVSKTVRLVSSPTLLAKRSINFSEDEDNNLADDLYSVKLKAFLMEGWLDITVHSLGATTESFM